MPKNRQLNEDQLWTLQNWRAGHTTCINALPEDVYVSCMLGSGWFRFLTFTFKEQMNRDTKRLNEELRKLGVRID